MSLHKLALSTALFVLLALASERASAAAALRCVAFSPYVKGFDPRTGPHPPRRLIAQLLDEIVARTPYRCLMTYGVLNGVDATFAEARKRRLRVIAILWLDADASVNDASIAGGIAAAKRYPKTIVRVSCGSELRTRHGNAFDAEISRCVSALRAAGVTQPITSNDTWWELCSRSLACAQDPLYASLDWIGVNVFPWWENRYSGYFPCTTAAAAADFHVARVQAVRAAYPNREVILTEFGWPAGPSGATEVNRFSAQSCGVAGAANQKLVVRGTLAKLDALGWPSVTFEAFREPWKAAEGAVGPYWGRCSGAPPYRCRRGY